MQGLCQEPFSCSSRISLEVPQKPNNKGCSICLLGAAVKLCPSLTSSPKPVPPSLGPLLLPASSRSLCHAPRGDSTSSKGSSKTCWHCISFSEVSEPCRPSPPTSNMMPTLSCPNPKLPTQLQALTMEASPGPAWPSSARSAATWLCEPSVGLSFLICRIRPVASRMGSL